MTVEIDDAKASEAIEKLAETIQRRKWEFPTELENPAWMAVAWLIRVSRTAESIALLYQNGFSSEAAPLVRSVIEHTASIAWLVAQKHEAIAAITDHHKKHQANLVKDAKHGGWNLARSEEELDRIDALLQPVASRSSTIPKVAQLCRRAGLKNAYVAFRFESGMTHASYLSGAAYWRDDSGSPRGFHYKAPRPGSSLRGAAVMLLIACALVDELSPDKDFETGLGSVQAGLGISILENTP